MPDKFYKVKPDKQAWLGNRYFRFNFETEKVTQVCINVGESVKKGKSNTIGIYFIHKTTLMCNYMSMNYLIPASKSEFKKKFDMVVKMLS